MKSFLIIFASIWGVVSAQNPLSQYSDLWNDAKFANANTAQAATYMNEDEKNIIHILNLARMDPQLFLKTIIEPIAKDYWFVNTNSKFYKSLINDLKKQKPLNLLLPDKTMFEIAYCHAKTMGSKGLVGHKRISKDCKEGFSGECCSYGISEPLEIIVQLLVDEGVESLGHRKILLGDFQKVGVSIQPHKSYEYNAVLDFSY
jgi:uncharacterized protein YkwD